MKVIEIETRCEAAPARERPIRDALQVLDGGGSFRLTIRTDSGLIGEASSFFGRVRGSAPVLKALVDQILAPLVLGQNPLDVRAIHEALLRETEYQGSSGLTMFGISAIDTALWDLVGKAANLPCHQLWGARTDRVPAYAMVAWLNFSLEELKPICDRALRQGFRAVKVKVGCPSVDEDIARIETVRSVVGRDAEIMVDANQVHTVAEAIRRGRVYEDLGCLWYEEPIPAHNYSGYGELCAALDIPIATGENLYGKEEFAELFRNRGVDILQPDIRRAGGPTEVMAVAQMAAAFGIPWASHGGGPVMLSLLCSMPGAAWLETGFVEGDRPTLRDGFALAPRGPGFAWE